MTNTRRISKENLELGEKIVQGFRMAYERLVKQEALLGRTLVVSKNGKPVHVSAKKLLKELENEKGK
jgi:hypothetical protein